MAKGLTPRQKEVVELLCAKIQGGFSKTGAAKSVSEELGISISGMDRYMYNNKKTKAAIDLLLNGERLPAAETKTRKGVDDNRMILDLQQAMSASWIMGELQSLYKKMKEDPEATSKDLKDLLEAMSKLTERFRAELNDDAGQIKMMPMKEVLDVLKETMELFFNAKGTEGLIIDLIRSSPIMQKKLGYGI